MLGLRETLEFGGGGSRLLTFTRPALAAVAPSAAAKRAPALQAKPAPAETKTRTKTTLIFRAQMNQNRFRQAIIRG